MTDTPTTRPDEARAHFTHENMEWTDGQFFYQKTNGRMTANDIFTEWEEDGDGWKRRENT